MAETLSVVVERKVVQNPHVLFRQSGKGTAGQQVLATWTQTCQDVGAGLRDVWNIDGYSCMEISTVKHVVGATRRRGQDTLQAHFQFEQAGACRIPSMGVRKRLRQEGHAFEAILYYTVSTKLRWSTTDSIKAYSQWRVRRNSSRELWAWTGSEQDQGSQSCRVGGGGACEVLTLADKLLTVEKGRITFLQGCCPWGAIVFRFLPL